MATLCFWLLAIAALLSAAAVIALRNPIYSALALVLNLLVVAAFYALLDAHFLAVIQVIVYAGAIVVLVLFVLMLLNQKMESPRAVGRLKWSALFVGGLFIVGLAPALGALAPTGMGAVGADFGTIRAVGRLLFSRYVLLFEAVSLLLLAAIVGALLLGRRRKGEAG